MAVHLQALVVVPATNSLTVMGFAGPTFFNVEQQLVTDVNFTHAYPFDTATFSSAVASRNPVRPLDSTWEPTSPGTSLPTWGSAGSPVTAGRRWSSRPRATKHSTSGPVGCIRHGACACGSECASTQRTGKLASLTPRRSTHNENRSTNRYRSGPDRDRTDGNGAQRHGQEQDIVSIAAGQSLGVDTLRQWDATVSGMEHAGNLVVMSRQSDAYAEGRTHEYLAQYHAGIPVHGGGVSRQLDPGGATVSLFGTLHPPIDVDTTPLLSGAEVAALLEMMHGGKFVADRQPPLSILPRPAGSYVLAYQVAMSDGYFYLAGADDGKLLHRVRAFKSQSAVGAGADSTGIRRKLSTTRGTLASEHTTGCGRRISSRSTPGSTSCAPIVCSWSISSI